MSVRKIKAETVYGTQEVACKTRRHKHHTYDTSDIESGHLTKFNCDLDSCHHHLNKSYYGVRIVTGAQKQAGTSVSGVYVILVGSNGNSGRVCMGGLLARLKGTFNVRSFDDFIIESDSDLGDIQVVIIGNDGSWLGGSSAWYVDFTVVYNLKNDSSEEFPCYHWIGSNGDEVSCTAHTTTINDVANKPILHEQRIEQLKGRKQVYQWRRLPNSGLPSCIDVGVSKLPDDEDFERVKNVKFLSDGLGSAPALIKGAFLPPKSMDTYEELAVTLGEPEISVIQGSRWTTDVEFGRQILNGVNPVVIRKCTDLPEKFPVTNEMVKGFLNRGNTLTKEMDAGHVYICDLTIMKGLECKEGFYVAAPMCLLYVNGSNQLVPIAIQLSQPLEGDSEPAPPIFLPSDNFIDWLLAKIHYQAASAQFHQLSTHYLSCHAAMEAYGMATMRCLPDSHPIYKLLAPHFRYTMAINSRARALLINKGGVIDHLFAIGGKGKEELTRRAGSAYRVDCTNIKESIKERGVDNPGQLPGYHYRDDGLKVWNAMETYVREIINLFYDSSNQAVASDTELQKWAKEVYEEAFPAFGHAPKGRGFPSEFKTIEQLVKSCTTIAFTGSAQHASINFGQYSMYGFAPNAPSGMRQPPPIKKGVSKYQDLLESLPPKQVAATTTSVAYTLSQFSPDEVFLGEFPEERFTEVKAQDVLKKFGETLKGISEEIKKRNETLDVPYKYFLPTQVPSSITI